MRVRSNSCKSVGSQGQCSWGFRVLQLAPSTPCCQFSQGAPCNVDRRSAHLLWADNIFYSKQLHAIRTCAMHKFTNRGQNENPTL